jgi:hypothetical protein
MMLTNPPPPSAENKNEWNCTPINRIRLHGVKWDNFILLYITQNSMKGL